MVDVEVLLRMYTPGERGKPIKVVARDIVFGGDGLERGELGEFIRDEFLYIF